MRKDVKIGLAIGGVLLAVLIVYAVVPKNNDSEYAREGDVSGVDDGGEAGTAGAGSTGATGTGADAGGGAAAGGGSESAGAGGARADAGDAGQAGGGGAQDPAAGDAASRQQAGATGEGADAPAAEAATPVPWDQILATGVVPEDLRIGMVAIEKDPFAKAAPESPSDNDNPVWPQGSSGTGTGGVVQPQAPQPPPQTGLPSTGIKTHTVQPGETYSKISLFVYGDARYYNELKKANPTVDEKRLRPGDRINIPDASTFKTRGAQQASASMAAAPNIDPKTEYQVQPGDSLYKISVKLYGKSDRADAIYELNKDKIGDDPARVKVGMVLKLPQPVASANPAR